MIDSEAVATKRPRAAVFGRLSWQAALVCLLAGLAGTFHVLPRIFLIVAGVALCLACGHWLLRRPGRKRRIFSALCVALVVAVTGAAVRTYYRYRTTPTMELTVQEYDNAEYPEDPAARNSCFGKYHGRTMRLVRRDATHFDFELEPRDAHIARIVFRNVDVSLMVTSLPEWTKADAGLRRIALTDREWNRQQVRFDARSLELEVTGGDGFEVQHLVSAELAKNCLNAGLWEVLLFAQEGGEKTLYYQNWFTFPLGHYKDVFEASTGFSYWDHWWYLEHWFDPAGTPVRLEGLREVVTQREVPAVFDKSEHLIVAGEQIRKRRTLLADNVVHWGDFYDGRRVEFAAFVPPGRYSVQHAWGNRYVEMDHFDKAILREIRSPARQSILHELELLFSGSRGTGVRRFIVSGFDLASLPKLPVHEYPAGLYMPMGIGVPPFLQTYAELQANPPSASPYVSVLLDDQDRWVDHHSLGIDGPVLHRDPHDPGLLHLDLLSYERHSLVAHMQIRIDSGE
jgi:hypothetical protein